MRRAALVPVLLAALACRSATPHDLPPSAIPGLVRGLPQYVRLFITGLAFHEGRLYAGSNIGLIEIEGDRTVVLHQWSSWDSVVEPPFRDEGGPALWAWLARSFDFVRRDAQGWTRVDLPPENYTRGHFLAGFRGYSVGSEFWIQGGGGVWRWNRTTSDWTRVELPPGDFHGLAPTSNGLLALSSQRRDFLSRTYDYNVYLSDAAGWTRIASATLREPVKEVVGAGDAGYAKTSQGNLVRFDRRGFQPIATPGVCETFAKTSEGTIVAMFLQKGLFKREGDAWKPLAPYPYGPEEGKHWAHLAEDRGQVAFATCEDAEIPNYNTGVRVWSGTSAIWVLNGDALNRVSLGEGR